jgi:methyl-accepting chemotaxis protein
MRLFSKAGPASAMARDHDLAQAVRQSLAMVTLDTQGVVQDANDAFLAIMGFALADLVGKPHGSLLRREDAAGADYARFWADLRSGHSQVGPVRRVRRDGTLVWLEAAYMPVKAADGTVQGVVATATDVTDRMKRAAEADSRVAAIDRSQAVIEFDLTGKIVTANAAFLACVGYGLDEIVGRHHSMFVTAEHAASGEYAGFWEQLRSGKFTSGEYRRVGKGGRPIWLQACYNPLLDADGKPIRVVKFAHDITANKRAAMDAQAQLTGLGRSQAVIEFDPTGKILGANDNFLGAMGYRLDEIVGRHHSMFVAPQDRESQAYRDFWDSLRQGKFQSAEYLRYGKGGAEVWIQATYNPVMGEDGKPVKVVKFATDVTERKHMIGALQQALTRLAEGDLTYRLEQAFPGTMEGLRADFNSGAERLGRAVGDVITRAMNVTSGASEIAQAADDLSRRTETQAATLEETAAALDQLTSSVRSAAGSAGEADQAVKGAGRRAEDSGTIMRQATEAMGEIEKSSQQISQIIGVIDDIAFQTNLLALNAGVEAARAGDAGRGFAVVASEVRSLAQRSADAAKEIKALISSSTGHVSRGVALVSQAGAALAEIVTSVTQVAGLVSAIASSANDQASGLAEISTGVNQLDQVTQQNAAMVEQTTAAAHSLRNEAESLSETVSTFRVSSAQGADVIAVRRKPPASRIPQRSASVGANEWRDA